MIVVLSGEGRSDLGACRNAQGHCSGDTFAPGPMTVLVDQEIASHLHYSPLECAPEAYLYVSETWLSEKIRARKQDRRKTSLIGKKHGQETGYYHINAWMLGEAAKDFEQLHKDIAIAVLFRDSDGSHAAGASEWSAKWQSMHSGFQRAELGVRGVPMLPKPKSEAWLLCAVANGYQDCEKLEALPGNDSSPHSAKEQLKAALGGDNSTEAQLNWLQAHGFDHEAVAANMPSYQQFKASLAAAIDEVCRPRQA
jgi:hypothetical protein